MGLPDHLTCLLRNLYAETYKYVSANSYAETTVRILHGTTDWFKIEKGVWRDCLLSHPACLIYTLSMSWKCWSEYELKAGIKTGRRSNNLRYADDSILMVGSEEELKNLLMRVKESEKVSLKLNIKNKQTKIPKIMASDSITSWQIVG